MRKLITIILVLIGFAAYAQPSNSSSYLYQNAKWRFKYPIWADSGMYVKNIVKNANQNRVCIIDSVTGKVGFKYITGGSTDTTSLSNRINLRVKYTDTSAMLAPYFLSSDSIQWRNRVRYADTAAMLTKYLRKADTLHMTYSLPLARGGNNLEMYPATTSTDGYLTDADWNIFNNKESVLTFSRGLSRSTNTVILDTTQYYTWTNARTKWSSAATTTSSYGLFSRGSGNFTGAGVQPFSGSATGTIDAINTAANTAANFADWQHKGTSRFRLDSLGNIFGRYSMSTPFYTASTGHIRANNISFIDNNSSINITGANGITSTNASIYFQGPSPVTYTNTSGTRYEVELDGTFSPTSGTAVHTAFYIPITINQTGGANGITRGIYINPTLTSAADFRAIEVAKGVVLMATYTFATLPTGIPTGSEVNISDSNTTTWGATIAGGGANNVKARWNGSNWTVIGI